MTEVPYLPAAKILAARRTEAPRNPSVSGYGNRIPTDLLLTLATGRERRVYAICYSNVASHYINVKGERLFIDVDAEERIEALAPRI